MRYEIYWKTNNPALREEICSMLHIKCSVGVSGTTKVASLTEQQLALLQTYQQKNHIKIRNFKVEQK